MPRIVPTSGKQLLVFGPRLVQIPLPSGRDAIDPGSQIFSIERLRSTVCQNYIETSKNAQGLFADHVGDMSDGYRHYMFRIIRTAAVEESGNFRSSLVRRITLK